MGRKKIRIKKLEDTIKRQVTYSKRRKGLKKKASDLSILCDIDVALITFSPSGKLTEFSTNDKMADVIERFANTSLHQRAKSKLESIKVIEELQKKLNMDQDLESTNPTSEESHVEVENLLKLLVDIREEKKVAKEQAKLFHGPQFQQLLIASEAGLIDTEKKIKLNLERVREQRYQFSTKMEQTANTMGTPLHDDMIPHMYGQVMDNPLKTKEILEASHMSAFWENLPYYTRAGTSQGGPFPPFANDARNHAELTGTSRNGLLVPFANDAQNHVYMGAGHSQSGPFPLFADDAHNHAELSGTSQDELLLPFANDAYTHAKLAETSQDRPSVPFANDARDHAELAESSQVEQFLPFAHDVHNHAELAGTSQDGPFPPYANDAPNDAEPINNHVDPTFAYLDL